MEPPLVGIIANPVSARDIRRVVSYAGNMQIMDRVNVVLRLLIGLAATGVDRVVMMPENGGIRVHLLREINRATNQSKNSFPRLNFLDMRVTCEAADSALAARMMQEIGVAAIIVLGGDGTHRVVVGECGDTPIASVSTGTNNAFPEIREPTITGLAVGLVATEQIPHSVAFRFNKRLDVKVNDRKEIALVDVAIVSDGYIGARAIWRPENFKELFVTFGEPGGMGMSSIVGLVAPVTRDAPYGQHIVFSPADHASFTVKAPIAPGLMENIGIESMKKISFDQPVPIVSSSGSIALDGEREISFSRKDQVSVVLRKDAFQTLDISRCMSDAATRGLFVAGESPFTKCRPESVGSGIN